MKIPLGHYCTAWQSNRCAGGGICIAGKCGCPFGSLQRGQQCIGNDQGKANNSCEDDPTTCRDGTYCLNGVCVCPRGHICAAQQSNEKT
ncbi:unnamed protein product, partial [Gongylonema pulchrum]|uniref:EB domain-containing protein n=1 Tax=Gongylonema pulchrum TaxID=637853 RepID=A0A183DG63_9BILA